MKRSEYLKRKAKIQAHNKLTLELEEYIEFCHKAGKQKNKGKKNGPKKINTHTTVSVTVKSQVILGYH